MIKYYKSFHLVVKWGRLKGYVYYNTLRQLIPYRFLHSITQVETTETAGKEESKLFLRQRLFSVYVWIQHLRK